MSQKHFISNVFFPFPSWLQQVLNDSETEDVLHAINPNDMYSSGLLQDTLSESDSGMSEEPQSDSLSPTVEASSPDLSVPTVYQVVYDISALGGIKTEPEHHNVDVISIQLGMSSQIQSTHQYNVLCNHVPQKRSIPHS